MPVAPVPLAGPHHWAASDLTYIMIVMHFAYRTGHEVARGRDTPAWKQKISRW